MKTLIFSLFNCLFFIVLTGCNSTGYEIEEFIDPAVTLKTAANTEIKKDLELQAAEIKVEKGGVESEEKVISKLFSIQIGAFEKEKNAEEFTTNAKNKLQYGFFYEFSGGLYKVRSANFSSESNTGPIISKIRDAGYIDSFMVEVSK